MQQLFQNLINNAIKFNDKEQPTVAIEYEAIQGEHLFAVKDNGLGIETKYQEQIFEVFKRLSREGYEGTGVGLAICKKIVEQHEGRIWVDSEEGEGSTFYFVLDFELGKVITPDKDKLKKESLTRDGLTGIRVLMAEDNKINQIVARKTLAKWNVDLAIANDGVEVVDMFKKGEYDIILMDINMPNMNGYDACKAIRKLEQGKDEIPIIALTASAFATIAVEAKKVGMNDHLGKPFDPLELYDKIKNCIDARLSATV